MTLFAQGKPMNPLLARHAEIARGTTLGPWEQVGCAIYRINPADNEKVELIARAESVRNEYDSEHIALADPDIISAYIAVAEAANVLYQWVKERCPNCDDGDDSACCVCSPLTPGAERALFDALDALYSLLRERLGEE